MLALPSDRTITDQRLWAARAVAAVMIAGGLSGTTTASGPAYLTGVLAAGLVAYYVSVRVLSEPAE